MYGILIVLALVVSYMVFSFSKMIDPSDHVDHVVKKDHIDVNKTKFSSDPLKNSGVYFGIVCRIVPKSFDYSKIKNFVYAVDYGSNIELCYKKFKRSA